MNIRNTDSYNGKVIVKMNPNFRDAKMWEELCLRMNEKGHLGNNLFTPSIDLPLLN